MLDSLPGCGEEKDVVVRAGVTKRRAKHTDWACLFWKAVWMRFESAISEIGLYSKLCLTLYSLSIFQKWEQNDTQLSPLEGGWGFVQEEGTQHREIETATRVKWMVSWFQPSALPFRLQSIRMGSSLSFPEDCACPWCFSGKGCLDPWKSAVSCELHYIWEL